MCVGPLAWDVTERGLARSDPVVPGRTGETGPKSASRGTRNVPWTSRPLLTPSPTCGEMPPTETVTSLSRPALGSLCQNSPSNPRESPRLRSRERWEEFRPEGRVTQRVRRSSADKGGSVWRASGEGGLNAEPSEFRLVPGFLLLPHYRSSPSSRVGKSRVDHDPAYPSEPVRTEVRVGWSS